MSELFDLAGNFIGDQSDPTKYLPWDSTLTVNPSAALQDNRGCPVGYFTQYVSSPWGTFGAAYVRVCRRMDQQILTDPAVNRAETGPGMVDQATVALADALRQIKEAATPAFSWALVAVAGLVALFIVTRR